MSEIVTDFAPSALIAAMEANLWAAARSWARLLDSPIFEEKGYTCFLSGIPLSMFNGVIRARFPAERAEDAIAALKERFETRGVPFVWLISPDSRPADIEQRLLTHDMVLDDEGVGMAVDLTALPDEEPLLPGLRIVEVEDDERLEDWVYTMAEGSNIPHSVAELLNNICSRHSLTPGGSARYFLALLGREPVATSLLFCEGGVAGIYCVSTLPAARKRGIGRAITLFALRAALAQGLRIGVLQSSRMGLNIYRALGFKEYCRFRFYFGG